MPRSRVVVDTNVLVSRLILPQSSSAQAVRKAELEAILLISDATMYELADVLARAKFDRYVSIEDRKSFVRRLTYFAEFVPNIQLVHECRDPKDDKFLEVALNGRADLIVTGDADLLELHPWREIAILSPTGYLEQ
ncbi:MAG: putative toxin-antitoxin system toxin component, PIN family [Candidatus Acidiferrales bacterium]